MRVGLRAVLSRLRRRMLAPRRPLAPSGPWLRGRARSTRARVVAPHRPPAPSGPGCADALAPPGFARAHVRRSAGLAPASECAVRAAFATPKAAQRRAARSLRTARRRLIGRVASSCSPCGRRDPKGATAARATQSRANEACRRPTGSDGQKRQRASEEARRECSWNRRSGDQRRRRPREPRPATASKARLPGAGTTVKYRLSTVAYTAPEPVAVVWIDMLAIAAPVE